MLLGIAASCGNPVEPDGPVGPVGPETLNAPTELTVGEITPTTAALSWATVEGAEKYFVVLNDGASIEVADVSYNAEGLKSPTDYTWKVQAVKGTVFSDWAEGDDFNTPVAPPSGLTVGVRRHEAALSWQQPKADLHEVVVDDGEAVSVNEPEFLLTGLAEDSFHTWKVRSHQSGVWSEWTEGEAFNTLKASHTWFHVGHYRQKAEGNGMVAFQLMCFDEDLYRKGTGQLLSIHIDAPGESDQIIPEGTYTVGGDSAWQIDPKLSGMIEYYRMEMTGSDDLTDGRVIITKTEEGIYTLVIDVETENGLMVMGTYSGTLPLLEYWM
jgi:hypothetical protein